MLIKKIIVSLALVFLVAGFIPSLDFLFPGFLAVVMRLLVVPLVGYFLIKSVMPKTVGIIKFITSIFLIQIIIQAILVSLFSLRYDYIPFFNAVMYLIVTFVSLFNMVWFWPLLIMVIAIFVKNKKIAELSSLSKRQFFFLFSGLLFILAETFVFLATIGPLSYYFPSSENAGFIVHFIYILESIIILGAHIIFLFSRKNNNL